MLKKARRAMLDIAKAPTRLRGTGVVVSDQFSPDNYCHWLLDWLPRILLAVRHVGTVNWIFARIGRLPFQTESLRMIPELANCHLIVDEGIQWYALDRVITVDNLKIPMTHPAWGANRAVLQLLRSVLIPPQSDTGMPDHRKRLYITRSDSGGRRIVINEQELRDTLASFGFEAVSLAGRSIVEQSTLFTYCEAVIGVHGAGLTNMLYMQAGGIAVELFHYRYGTSAYAKLANSLDLRYFYMSCDGAVGSRAPYTDDIAHSNSHIDTSIWVDPAALRAGLSHAGL
jgi:capsular polysaccharide biosynthesis protein